MQDYEHFSPGLFKLIHNPEHLVKIKRHIPTAPLHVSFFPNNQCQLSCKYCCFGKTLRNNIQLTFDDFKKAVDILSKYGTKAIEFSGGGESLLWNCFDEAVIYAKSLGLKTSLVTNGLLLKEKSPEILNLFDWIRVSIQSAEYAEKIKRSHITTQFSMSYIVYDDASFAEIDNVSLWAKKNNIIVRVAPYRPCSNDYEDHVINKVASLGFPLIAFKKSAATVPGCYMAWIRAAIDWKGNFLPCPSIELSFESPGVIPDDFSLCHVSNLEEWILNNAVHDLGYRCKFCNCGNGSNEYLHRLIQPIEFSEFV